MLYAGVLITGNACGLSEVIKDIDRQSEYKVEKNTYNPGYPLLKVTQKPEDRIAGPITNIAEKLSGVVISYPGYVEESGYLPDYNAVLGLKILLEEDGSYNPESVTHTLFLANQLLADAKIYPVNPRR